MQEKLENTIYSIFFTGKDLLKVGSTGDFLIQPNNYFYRTRKDVCVEI